MKLLASALGLAAALSQSPNILTVHPSLPVKNVKDLIGLAKAKPGTMNFSSAGSGDILHYGIRFPFRVAAASTCAAQTRSSR